VVCLADKLAQRDRSQCTLGGYGGTQEKI
jgi:hypothetical protein